MVERIGCVLFVCSLPFHTIAYIRLAGDDAFCL